MDTPKRTIDDATQAEWVALNKTATPRTDAATKLVKGPNAWSPYEYHAVSFCMAKALERELNEVKAALQTKDDTIEALLHPELRISGETAHSIIVNVHGFAPRKFRNSPLWSLVSHITGHGCGFSQEICISANLDPHQLCGVKGLAPCKP